MSELPGGWEDTTLEECAAFNPRHDATISPEADVSFVPMSAVSDVEGEIVSPTTRAFAEVAKGYTHFQQGDVIFAKITPCMENGKIAVARKLESGVACGSTEFHVLRPLAGVSADYVWRFLRQKSFRDDAEASMTGAVGQRRVPTDFLKKTHLPLPPAPEQLRIVAKVDSLSGKSKRARDHLDHIPRLVEKYKQAVLAAAFQGDLTRQWRAARKASVWSRTTAGSVVLDIVSGKNLRCEERRPMPHERGVLKVSAVSWGTFDPDAAKTLPTTFTPTERSRVRPGDLLISRANTLELVGAVVVVGEAPPNLFLSDKVLRLEMDEQNKPWMLWFLRSPLGRDAIESMATGNQLSMRNLSQSALKAIDLPWPEAGERSEIVRRIEFAFTWIDQLASEATSARRLIDVLEQAVLAKAFRGELAPQDPTDEPASVLLERIRASHRAALAKRGRKARVEA